MCATIKTKGNSNSYLIAFELIILSGAVIMNS